MNQEGASSLNEILATQNKIWYFLAGFSLSAGSSLCSAGSSLCCPVFSPLVHSTSHGHGKLVF